MKAFCLLTLLLYFAQSAMSRPVSLNEFQTPSNEFNFNNSNHLKFFGYYWSDLAEVPKRVSGHGAENVRGNFNISGTDHCGGDHEINYIDEFGDHTNLSWISLITWDRTDRSEDRLSNGVNPHLERILCLMRRAISFNNKIVLAVTPIVVPDINTTKRYDYTADEYREVQRDLEYFWEHIIEANGLENHVEMIYPIDEPYKKYLRQNTWRSFTNIFTNHYEREIRRINEHLEEINRIVKRVTRKKVGVFFHPTSAQNGEVIIDRSYDWVGFSCYTNMSEDAHELINRCGAKRNTFESLMSRMLSRMEDHQKFMIAAEAWQRVEGHAPGLHPHLIQQRLQRYYEIALAEPRVVALVPFLWRSYAAPSETGRGARDIEEIKPMLREIGEQISQNQRSFPSSSIRENSHKPRGEVTVKQNTGRIWGWAFDEDMRHLPSRIVVRVNGSERFRFQSQHAYSRTNINLKTVGPHVFQFDIPQSYKDGGWNYFEFIALNNEDSGRQYNQHHVLGRFSAKYEDGEFEYTNTRRVEAAPKVESNENCDIQEYYRRRPDVKNHYYFGKNNRALLHYERHGKKEGMCKPYLSQSSARKRSNSRTRYQSQRTRETHTPKNRWYNPRRNHFWHWR